MKKTVSLKQNYEFQRLYRRGKNTVSPVLVLYSRKNGRDANRLGITVGTKLGKAVRRNLVRRRIRECYRLREGSIKKGYDLVVVARVRAAGATYRQIDRALETLLEKQGLLESAE